MDRDPRASDRLGGAAKAKVDVYRCKNSRLYSMARVDLNISEEHRSWCFKVDNL